LRPCELALSLSPRRALSSSLVELHFAGEEFVVLHNFINRIQPAQRCEWRVCERRLDRHRLALHGRPDSERHLSASTRMSS